MNLYFMLVYAFFYRLYISVIFYTKYAMGQIKLTKKVQPLDYDQKYQKYIKYYKEAADTDANTNIGADLYDYDARKTLFAEEKNEPERLWKTRILYEFTERGNVLFYYNPYKLSFEYYSDVQIIPYKILQYIAKKYVAMNRCRDFYIDMVERQQNKMIDVLRKEEDAMKSKKMKVNDTPIKKPTLMPNIKPIVNKNAPISNAPISNAQVIEPAEKPLQFANKYVRLGKIGEFNIMQKQPKKSIAQTNDMMFGAKSINKMTDFFDDLEIEEEEVNPFSPSQISLTNDPVLTKEAELTKEAIPEVLMPKGNSEYSSYKMFKNLKIAKSSSL